MKRKHPRSRLINPLIGLQPLSEVDRTNLSLQQHLALSSLRKGQGSERDLFELVKALELLYIALSERPDYFVSSSDGLSKIRQMAMSVYLSIEKGRELSESNRRWLLDEVVQRDMGEALLALDELLRHSRVFHVDVWLSMRRQSVRSGYFRCLKSGD